MKIWLLNNQFGKFEVLCFSDEKGRKLFQENFRGEPMEKAWSTVQVETFKEGPESDFPEGLLSPPVFSEEAVQVLQPLMQGKVELLPLITEKGKKYYAGNVLNVIDGIDEKNTEVKRSRSGAIMKYNKFSFHQGVVEGQDIFKVLHLENKNPMNTKVFVSDQFRDKVLESGLKGFDFIEVWDSENSDGDVSVRQVPSLDTSKENYSFEEATNLVEKQNEVVVSESLEWAMRLGEEKQTQIGHLQEDGKYQWMNPIYYPPIFLEVKWKIVNASTNKL